MSSVTVRATPKISLVKNGLAPRTAAPASPAASAAPAARATKLSFRSSIGGIQVQARSRAHVTSAVNTCIAAVAASEDVSVTTEEQGNSHVSLTINVPVEKLKETYAEVVQEYAAAVDIPGFKKGRKIPDSIVANYIGKDEINSAVVERVLTNTLPIAMKGVEDRALDGSEAIATPVKDMVANFTTKEPMTYKVDVDVAPEVGFKSSYKELAVEVHAASDDKIDEGDVEKIILSKRKEMGKMNVVVDRGIQMSDVIVFTMEANRVDNGDPVIQADNRGFNLDTDEEADFLPGLFEAIKGWKVGDTGKFKLTFPDYWEPAALRNVEAEFDVKINEVFQRDLPEADDSIAASLSPGASNLEEARKTLMEAQKKLSEDLTNQEIQAALTRALADITEVDPPQFLLQEQARQLYSAKLLELVGKGQISQEMIPQLSQPSLVENFMEKQADEIMMMVKSALAVAEICKLEGIEADEESMAVEVASAVEEFKSYGQEYDKEKLVEQAREVIEGSNVLKLLKDNCKVTVLPPKPKGPVQTS